MITISLDSFYFYRTTILPELKLNILSLLPAIPYVWSNPRPRQYRLISLYVYIGASL